MYSMSVSVWSILLKDQENPLKKAIMVTNPSAPKFVWTGLSLTQNYDDAFTPLWLGQFMTSSLTAVTARW